MVHARNLAAVLALAAVASASCGKTKEEERIDAVRNACRSFVPGSTVYRDAAIALENGQLRNQVCGGPLTPEGTDDVCDYGQVVCQDDFIYVANDVRACKTGAGGGCIYGCVLRMSKPDLDANGSTAKVCARFFYGPQPCSAVEPGGICQ